VGHTGCPGTSRPMGGARLAAFSSPAGLPRAMAQAESAKPKNTRNFSRAPDESGYTFGSRKGQVLSGSSLRVRKAGFSAGRRASMMRKLTVLCALSVVLNVNHAEAQVCGEISRAGQFEDGVTAYQRGDFATALGA
jgi:hypothetical protein